MMVVSTQEGKMEREEKMTTIMLIISLLPSPPLRTLDIFVTARSGLKLHTVSKNSSFETTLRTFNIPCDL